MAGCEENRNEEETEGSEETDSPEGLEGDGSELRGDPGCESERGAVLVKSDKAPIGTVRRSGMALTVSTLDPGIGISIVKGILKEIEDGRKEEGEGEERERDGGY